MRFVTLIIFGLSFLLGVFFFREDAENFLLKSVYRISSDNNLAQASNVLLPKISDIPAPVFDAESVFSVKMSGSTESVIYQENAQKKMSIASLSKLMTSLVAVENYPLDKKITITKTALGQDGDIGKMQTGEQISVETLLHMLLISSSNDAAYALSEGMDKGIFIDKMNKKAREIGMEDTNFLNPSGLNGNENYSTAKDLATLARYIVLNYPQIFQITVKTSEDIFNSDGSLRDTLKNTNELLAKPEIWQAQIIGGKTGYNEKALGCLIIVMRNGSGDYLVNIILGSNDRFSEMEKLINWVEETGLWH